MKAAEIRRRLTIRYGRTTQGIHVPEYAVAFEVPFDSAPIEIDGLPVSDYKGRAITKRQRMDAVAVGLWARTEHLVHGFEIKVSRSDLLAELANPVKSAPAVALVDRWWLVVAADILRDGDLDRIPSHWGVLVTHGHRLRCLREAAIVRHDYAGLDRRFVAGVMQSWMRRAPAYGLGRVAGYEDGYKRATQHAEASAAGRIRMLEAALRETERERDVAREQYAVFGDSPV